MLIEARLTGWFRVSLYALPWVSPNITKLSLPAVPYSITSSAKVDRLWSSVFYGFHLFNFIYSGIRKRHLWAFPWASCINCLNMCRIPTGFASGWRCCFVFRAPFDSIYISVLSHSPHFIVDLERESLLFGEPYSRRRLFIRFIRLLRPSLLPKIVYLVSLLLFSPIYHFIAF